MRRHNQACRRARVSTTGGVDGHSGLAVSAAIYARVSTGAQDKAGTIETQLAVCRRHCSQRGWQVVGEFLDRAISGAAALDSREQLMRALALGADGNYRYLVAFDMSRLMRDDLDGVGAILGAVRRAGLVIVEASTGRQHTLEGYETLTTVVTAILGNLDLEERYRRTNEGRKRHVAQGGKGTRPPWGLERTATDTWRWDPEKAAVVREVFQRYVDGERPAAIARALGARGAPKPNNYVRKGDPGSAAGWTRHSVRHLLRQEAYTGVWRRWHGEHIQLLTPLIDPSTWDRTRDILTSRQRKPGPTRTKPNLLGDHGRCALCGSGMGRTFSHKRWQDGRIRVYYEYYRCKASTYRQECSARGIRADRVNPQVWRGVTDLLVSRWDEIAGAIADAYGGDVDRGVAEQEVRALEKRHKHALRGYRQALEHAAYDQSGPPSRSHHNWQLVRDLGAEADGIERDMEHARRALADLAPLEAEAMAAVEILRDALVAGEEQATEEERAEIVAGLFAWLPGHFVIGKDTVELVLTVCNPRAPARMCARIEHGQVVELQYVSG